MHVIVTHLGVGDGIIQSGLAVALLERYERLAFPTYPRQLATFKSIFAAEPRITAYTVPRVPGEDWGSPRDSTYDAALAEQKLLGLPQVRLGMYSGRGIGWDFTKSFYEQANVDYEMRWRACPIASAWQCVPQVGVTLLNGQKRIFLHDDNARGFIIHRGRVGRGYVLSPSREIDQSILRYAAFMIDADEVHCIDSAFFWLADSLPCRGRLYLHKYPRWQRPWDFQYETYRHWNYVG
jgi:hypothetical protein